MATSRKATKTDRSPLLRYGVAVLSVAIGLSLMTIPVYGPRLGMALFYAILVSAWYGGLGPGLLTTALIAVATLFFQAIRVRAGLPVRLPGLIALGLFTLGGVVITTLVEALHRARRRAEEVGEEARRHQETLRESEARLEAILEYSPAVVYLKDPQGRYLMVNRRFETLFHVTEESVIGKTDHELFPEAEADAFRANDRRVLEARRAIEFEEVAPHDDGPHTYLSIKFPLFATDGSISAICGKSTDITDRKRSEEQRTRFGRHAALRADVSMALALSEPALPSILQHCVEAEFRHLDVASARIWTLDESGDTLILQAEAGIVPPGGESRRRIAREDPVFATIVRGRRPQAINDLGGQDPADPRHAWAREGIVAFAGHPLIVEGRLLGVMAVFARRPIAEDTLETLATLADLIAQGIERKRLEGERIDLLASERTARAEAESANHAKDQFLAVLSHELRTPLAPILASVSAQLAEADLPPEFRSVLELTHWGIELETRLIDDLLDMTRIRRGEMRLRRETTDAHLLLRQSLEVCRPEIEEGKHRLVLDLAAAEHHLDADPSRLKQVFWSLLRNSVKFSPGGGTLTIRTRNEPRLSSPTGAPDVDLLIEISDTGIGIEPDLLPKIFDAFIQGEAGWVRRFGGLGLGLAISRSVIEAHGGRIVAESRGSNQGATFTVTLATVPAPAAPAPRSASPGPALGPPRMLKILLVEDDGPTLKVMTRLLSKAPHAVKTANTLASALEIATSEDFDLIISDIGLPDGSGLELMRQIRDRYTARGIALSGYGMEEDIRRSREAGFLAHLIKPVDFQKLQVAIQQVTSTPVC